MTIKCKQKPNTKVFIENYSYEGCEFEDWTIVKLHNTQIVQFNSRTIILNSGGWNTSVTRRRMNQASEEFNLNFQVWTVKKELFVKLHGLTRKFSPDNTVLLTRKDVRNDKRRI